MTDKSPNWTKPSDVMRIRRKKKSISKPQLSRENDPIAACTSGDQSRVRPSNKRRNPFGCSPPKQTQSPRKRANLRPLDVHSPPKEDTKNGILFGALDQAYEQTKGLAGDTLAQTARDEYRDVCNQKSDITTDPADLPTDDKPEAEPQGEERVPVDWSLRTKVRFISHKPFSWCHPLKTTEEASGVTSFVRCTSPQGALTTEAAKCEFKRCSMYWQHPSLPWIRLFPRITADNKIGKPQAWLQEDAIQTAITADWSSSFTSVFHMLRAKTCPYFYFCTHQFTVLFRAAGLSNSKLVHALVTPTTRGFREALKHEGIEFSLPLCPQRRKSTVEAGSDSLFTGSPMPAMQPLDTETTSCKTLTEDDAEIDDPEEEVQDTTSREDGASAWLESMGLNKKEFPALAPNRIKLQRDSYKLIDHRPESLVHVEGANTQALFNYLLNCRSCVANSGPQTGIPPTILCPVAFPGATLKNLQVKQGVLKQQMSDGSLQQAYNLELTGPLLPSLLLDLTHLLKERDQNFTATFGVHEPSTPFNAMVPQTKESPEQATGRCLLANCGMSLNAGNAMALSHNFGKKAIRELTYDVDDKLYHWVL